MHVVNSCANNLQPTENVSKLQTIYEQILVSFCIVFPLFCNKLCRMHCQLTSLLMGCFSNLHGKQFPSILNKTTYFHMHIYISEYFISLCCRFQVVVFCTFKEYSKDIQFLATPHITIPPRNLILDCITSYYHKEDIYKPSS